MDPDLPEMLLANADMAFSRGDLEECRRQLGAGRAALSGDATFWHLLGFIEQRAGRWRASDAAFTCGFHLDGPATAEWLGVHFLHLRQYANARRVLAVDAGLMAAWAWPTPGSAARPTPCGTPSARPR